MDKLLTTAEVAKLLGCGTRKVKYLPIPIVRIGQSRRYDPRDVERFVESCKEMPATALPTPRVGRGRSRTLRNVIGLEEAIRLHPAGSTLKERLEGKLVEINAAIRAKRDETRK